MSIGERLCAGFIPLIAIVEALISVVADCCNYHGRPKNATLGFSELSQLAEGTQCLLFESFSADNVGFYHRSFCFIFKNLRCDDLFRLPIQSVDLLMTLQLLSTKWRHCMSCSRS